MVKELKKELGKKDSKFLKQLGLVLVIAIIATIIDWIVHSSSPRFYVEFGYYVNKIIFSVIWGVIILFIFRKLKNITAKTFIFAGFIALVLQVKYFLQGYDRFFVFLFMFLHFLMFLIPAWIIFKKFPEYFNS